jgi:hypothetical protein
MKPSLWKGVTAEEEIVETEAAGATAGKILVLEAGKLRERTEAVIKKGSKLIGSPRDSVDTTTEAE